MNIRHSETYCRPSGARYLVGSTLAPCIYRADTRCKEYEDDRGSSLFSAKVCETNENVRKILRVAMLHVLSSSRENKGRVGIDTGKEVHGIREWELQ